MTPTSATMVVPCYDEALRLDADAMRRIVDTAGVDLVLVDDGSTDGTLSHLRTLAASRPDAITVVARPTNSGKGSAVHAGLLTALESGAQLVGYFDADLSTPPAEIARLVDVARERVELDIVIGSRVGLLGHDIRRSASRHYLGRVFATASSLVLGLQVYDTQCGAKVFRATPGLRVALAEPFRSRWAFDVELLARLLRGAGDVPGVASAAMLEVPLLEWSDVSGSKLGLRQSARALRDLAWMGATTRRRSV